MIILAEDSSGEERYICVDICVESSIYLSRSAIPPLQVLAGLHGAQRKLLRAQRASLCVCLEKLNRGGAQVADAAATSGALARDAAVKRAEAEALRAKEVEAEAYIATLAAEEAVQEEQVGRSDDWRLCAGGW